MLSPRHDSGICVKWVMDEEEADCLVTRVEPTTSQKEVSSIELRVVPGCVYSQWVAQSVSRSLHNRDVTSFTCLFMALVCRRVSREQNGCIHPDFRK